MKKGQIGSLQGIIITLVVVGLFLGIGFMVLEEFYENTCESWNETSGECDTQTEASSGLNTTISAVGKVPTWLGIIVILAIVGILLAIVFSVLPGNQEGSEGLTAEY
jgi:hypothetical protein